MVPDLTGGPGKAPGNILDGFLDARSGSLLQLGHLLGLEMGIYRWEA